MADAPAATPRWVRLTRRRRMAAGLVAAGFLLLAAMARMLTPDPRGVGTHEQLGLPPCMTMTLFHAPCPFCGMTTSFALMARGDFREAFLNQPAGAVFFLAGAVGAAVLLVCAAIGWAPWTRRPRRVRSRLSCIPRRGRRVHKPSTASFVKHAAWIALAVLMLAWSYRLVLSLL